MTRRSYGSLNIGDEVHFNSRDGVTLKGVVVDVYVLLSDDDDFELLMADVDVPGDKVYSLNQDNAYRLITD